MMIERRTQSVDVTALTEYLAAQPDVIAAYLFGSRATGRARAESDVDVAVLLNEEDNVARFERRLQMMVEVSDVCGREADVIVLNDVPPILQNQVLRYGRLLFERDRRARVEFEVLSRRIYFDYKPVLDRQTRELFREIKEVGLGGRRRHHRGTIEVARRVHRRLRELQEVTFQEYLENKFIRKFVERTLQTALEACLDIGHRLISIAGFRYPSDNKDVFAVLAEERVLPWELLPTLQRMVSFRNVLVHEYAKLDHATVYGVFKKRLGDFDAYAEAIVSYLEGLQAEARGEG